MLPAEMTPACSNSASRVTSGVAAAAVCEAAVRWPGAARPAGPAGLHGEHRDLLADTARGAPEFARAAERLNVQYCQPGQFILFPPQEHVVA